MFPSFNPGHVGIKVSIEEGIPMAKRHGFIGFDFPMLEAEAWAEGRGEAPTAGWADGSAEGREQSR